MQPLLEQRQVEKQAGMGLAAAYPGAKPEPSQLEKEAGLGWLLELSWIQQLGVRKGVGVGLAVHLQLPG